MRAVNAIKWDIENAEIVLEKYFPVVQFTICRGVILSFATDRLFY